MRRAALLTLLLAAVLLASGACSDGDDTGAEGPTTDDSTGEQQVELQGLP